MKNSRVTGIVLHAIYLFLLVVLFFTPFYLIRLLNQPGDFAEGFAIATVLLLIIMIVFFIKLPISLLNVISGMILIVKYAKNKTPRKITVFDVVCKILMLVCTIFFGLFSSSLFSYLPIAYKVFHIAVNAIFLVYSIILIVSDFKLRKKLVAENV